MGKCSICGKKIEYNKYKMVNGDVYCPDCVPKTNFEKAVEKEIPYKTLDEAIEVTKAEEEAVEQFEKEMSGHGDKTIKVDSKVMDKLEEVQSYQYKPKKKRSRKKQ